MSEYTLGVIGGGNMAEAILRGVIDAGLIEPSAIVVSDPAEDRREHLSALGIACIADNLSAATCPRVLLAVKPQAMNLVLCEIAGSVRPDALVVSIAAGVATHTLHTGLGATGRIIRVMPNTPMLVGQGMSAIAAGPGAQEEDMQWAQAFFAASGKTVIVDESMMDAVTAVSGSGPAYFFYLVEAMVSAGVAEGLTRETALILASQTCLGAGKLLVESGESPAELRARVTSPGGTTQSAITSLESAGVQAQLMAAARAAARRSRELGS